MKTYKKVVVVLMATIFSIALVACGDGNINGGHIGEDGTVFLTFAGRSVDSERTNYEIFLNEFMEATGYVVNMQWYANETAYMLALDGMGTNLPDLFMLSNNRFMAYASSNKLYDYKHLVSQQELDQIYSNGYDIYSFDQESKQVGYSETAGLYGLPKDQGPYGLVYNKTLYEESAAEYNRQNPLTPVPATLNSYIPLTFNEFIAIGEKIKTVLSSNQYFVAEYDLQSAIFSNNADFFTADARTSKITDENFVESIEFLQTLYNKGLTLSASSTGDSRDTAFLSGRAIFHWAGPFKSKDYWQTLNFEWDLIPYAKGPADGAVSTSYVGGMGYVVSANSQVKEYAVELAKFLSLYESSQRTQYQRGQAIPNLISMADEFINDTYGLLDGKNPDHRSVWIDVVDGYGTEKVDDEGNTYIDQVTGRYSAEAYTYNASWLANLKNWLSGQGSNGRSVWKNEITPSDALYEYEHLFQLELDEMWELFED